MKPCNTQSCTEDRNCALAIWGPWSGCTASCFGTKTRTRNVEVAGAGKGKFCNDETKQVKHCNTDRCMTDSNAADCEFAAWQDWGACSATCGLGQHARQRTVAQEATNGGSGCDGPMSVLQKCQIKQCEPVKKIDCQWSDWDQWSACTKCRGQRSRARHIKMMNKNGGLPCPEGAEQETEGCATNCESYHCFWAAWEDWGDCSSTCGSGKRQRQRQLELSDATPEAQRLFDDSAKTNANLIQKTQSMENNRAQELVVSFAIGAFSLAVLFSCVRMFSGARTLNSQHVLRGVE